MKVPRINWYAVIAAAFALALPGTAFAQQDGPAGRADRARTFLVLRIAEHLDLSDEKALRVSEIFAKASERRESLRAERAALAPQLESAIAAADEPAITELVSQARTIDRKLLVVVADSFDEVDSVLTVAERGKLALLIPQIQDQLRRGGRRGLRSGRRGEEAPQR